MGIVKKKLEEQALKEIAYKDAEKHCTRDQIFNTPNVVDIVTKVYENEYYIVYEQKHWGYNEILDKGKYGDNWYGY